MAHGILHLLDFDDHTEQERALMRDAEEQALKLLPQFGLGDDQVYHSTK